MVFAALYAFTLDNGLRSGELAGGDLITHQYAQVQGRPSNAPGYPLYTMGGWLWFRAGRALLGADANPIHILSSYSTLWALMALALLYAICIEVIGRVRRRAGDAVDGRVLPGWALALLVTAFYGLTYFFWYYAVTSEQYTSSVAWTLAVVLLAFRWERGGQDRMVVGLALLMGVGLAHQVTVLAIAPPLAWFILSRGLPAREGDEGGEGVLRLHSAARTTGRLRSAQDAFRDVLPAGTPDTAAQADEERSILSGGRTQCGRSRRSAIPARLLPALLLAAALPLLSYAFIYLRGAQHPEWRGAGEWTSTAQWFLSFISTGQGRGELTWSLTPFFTAEFPALIWREMTWPGLLAGLAGMAALGRRRALFFYATIAVYLVFCWIDRLGNWYQVIMPVYALLAIGLAAGAAWLEARVPRGVRSPVAALVVLALLALAVCRGAASYGRANASNRPDDTGLAPGWAILADDPPGGTPIFATQEEALSLQYLAQIWGRRPDLVTVDSRAARARIGDAAIAVTRAALPLVPAEVNADSRYSALGQTLTWTYLAPRRELPAGLATWGYEFGGVIRLAGGRVKTNAATGDLVVTLVWQALAEPEEDWSVSVRLTQGGAELAQVDHVHPVSGAYPTSRWAAGEVVADAYAFAVPPGAEPSGLTVILYRTLADGSFTNLDVARLPLPAP